MSICTRPTMLTTLLSRRPVCLDWKDESRMLERRPITRPSKGKLGTWGHSTQDGRRLGGSAGLSHRSSDHNTHNTRCGAALCLLRALWTRAALGQKDPQGQAGTNWRLDRESGAWDHGGEGARMAPRGWGAAPRWGGAGGTDLGTMLSLQGKQRVHGGGGLGVDQLQAQAGASMES